MQQHTDETLKAFVEEHGYTPMYHLEQQVLVLHIKLVIIKYVNDGGLYVHLFDLSSKR